jgi:hypothetical protein
MARSLNMCHQVVQAIFFYVTIFVIGLSVLVRGYIDALFHGRDDANDATVLLAPAEAALLAKRVPLAILHGTPGARLVAGVPYWSSLREGTHVAIGRRVIMPSLPAFEWSVCVAHYFIGRMLGGVQPLPSATDGTWDFGAGEFAEWDDDHPLALLGHSSGGNAATDVAELMASGAYGEHRRKCVLAVASVSAPHRGTATVDVLFSTARTSGPLTKEQADLLSPTAGEDVQCLDTLLVSSFVALAGVWSWACAHFSAARWIIDACEAHTYLRTRPLWPLLGVTEFNAKFARFSAVRHLRTDLAEGAFWSRALAPNVAYLAVSGELSVRQQRCRTSAVDVFLSVWQQYVGIPESDGIVPMYSQTAFAPAADAEVVNEFVTVRANHISMLLPKENANTDVVRIVLDFVERVENARPVGGKATCVVCSTFARLVGRLFD